MTLRIRDAKPDDMGLIVDAWRKSFEDAHAVVGADRDHYHTEMARMIGRLCGSPASTVRVACDPDDEDTVVAFAAFSGTELHYVYVKRAFRDQYIVPDLLEGAAIDSYTFRPRTGFKIHDEGPMPAPLHWRFTPRFTL